jgi:hypothetical protein
MEHIITLIYNLKNMRPTKEKIKPEGSQYKRGKGIVIPANAKPSKQPVRSTFSATKNIFDIFNKK